MPRIIETETRYTTEPPCRTAEEMAEICCEEAPALPCCEKTEGDWGGFTEEEVLAKLGIVLDAQGRDEQGRYVEIRFEPRDRPCGEMVTKYDLRKNNCCGEIPPLAWNHEATPDVLPHGGEIWLYATGGVAPYSFSVTNHALFFDDGRRSWVSNVPYARLHAGETFCGSAVVMISDGCSSAQLEVRSDLGGWVSLGPQCVLTGLLGTHLGDLWFEAVHGRYRQVERVTLLSWAGPPGLSCYGGTAPAAPGYEGKCLSGPNCNQKIMDAVATTRPVGTTISTCLIADPAVMQAQLLSTIYGTYPDGAICSQGSPIESFSCYYTDGASSSGSQYRKRGYYWTTLTLEAFEWLC